MPQLRLGFGPIATFRIVIRSAHRVLLLTQLSIAAFNVLLIHSEMVLLLALAVAAIRSISSKVKRTCTILPFAVSVESFGRPTLGLTWSMSLWLSVMRQLSEVKIYCVT